MTKKQAESKFKRKLNGVVVGNKNDKTIVVKVERRFKHKLYNKFVTRSKKYHTHDSENKAKEGDQVSIIESKPWSKMKKWKLFSIHS